MSFRMIVLTAGVLAAAPAGAQDAPDPPPPSSGVRVSVGHARIELPSAGTATATPLDGTPTRGVVWRTGGATLELFAAHGFFAGKDIPKALDAVQASFGRVISKTDLPLPGASVAPVTYAREITLDTSIKRLFVFEDDLYVVSATSFRGPAVRAAADKLFGTFKWGPLEGVSAWLVRSTADCMCQFGMPDSTEKPTSTSKSPSGSTQNIWITNRDQTDRFVVMVGLKSADGAPADAMVEAAATAALRGKKGDKKTIKIGAYPGRELVVTADGATTFTRMYVANGHMYAIAYSAPTPSIDAAARDQFFASFIPRASVRR